MAGDRQRCLQAGLDGYVSKPVEAEELFEAVERIGNEGRQHDGPDASCEPITAVLDREAMFRRVGADVDLLLEMVKEFNQESAKLLDQIRQSIAQGNAVHLERAAHSLKGALRTLAAPAASEAALQLEVTACEGDLSGVEEKWRVLEREMIALRRALSALVIPGRSEDVLSDGGGRSASLSEPTTRRRAGRWSRALAPRAGRAGRLRDRGGGARSHLDQDRRRRLAVARGQVPLRR
jgi:HPt (histidine-containing phosphotransfer) domain-containing protein